MNDNNNMYKAALIIGFLVPVAFFIYFVSGVSGVNPPIQEYEYEGSVGELMTEIKEYVKATPNAKYTVDDTVGDVNRDFAIHLTVKVKQGKNNLEYHFKFNPEDDKTKPPVTVIGLIMAYNATTNTGGYEYDANGVKLLTEYFDTNIVPFFG